MVVPVTIGGSLPVSPPGGEVPQGAPYVFSLVTNAQVRVLLSAGDWVNLGQDGRPYRLVGVPDGLGVFDNGDGTFTLLVNHELARSSGAVRAHGAPGAFVSRWVVRKSDLRVVHGEDLIRQVATWDVGAGRYRPASRGVALSRLCSADLPERTAFYDAPSGLGYDGVMFLSGEEAGGEGRAFAHLLDGTSYELPWMGRYSFENVVAHPQAGRKTVVVGLDDSDGGQLYVYVGEKAASGNPVERAGLAGGVLYGVRIEGFPVEPQDHRPLGPLRFSLHPFGNVAGWRGARLEQASRSAGVTAFRRPEDGAWDPNRLTDFYFVTTASLSGRSRLWRLRFDDIAHPELGGTVEVVLAGGADGPRAMDNLAITRRGELLIQEDPGNVPYLARVWRYRIADGALQAVLEHNPALFAPGAPGYLTHDEESSGIVDASSVLGEGWVLLAVQAHYRHPDPELVEGGQLLAVWLPPMP